MTALAVIVALVVVALSVYYYTSNKTKEAPPPVVVETKKAEPEKVKKKEPKKVERKPKPKRKTVDPRFVRRFGGHSDSVLAMDVSPNGEWMATSGNDGQLRVTRVIKKKGQDMHLTTNIKYSEDIQHLKGRLATLNWCSGDNRTLVGTLLHSSAIAFFRVRKKKDASATDKFPFELVELSKRRFATDKKVQGTLNSSVVDHSHTFYTLLLTESDDPAHGNVVVAWDGTNGVSVGKGILGKSTKTTPVIRLSPDGRFLCHGCVGGTEAAGVQVKLFEVIKKKTKGEVAPVFDRISPKGVMTLVVGEKVADVCFNLNGNTNTTNLAIVGCVGGLIQVWSLDVDYRNREDPKLLCSTQLPGKAIIMSMVASTTSNRVAVITANSDLYVLSYSESSLKVDLTIEETHEELVADVKFCPSGADTVFTRGDESKDIFAWNIGGL